MANELTSKITAAMAKAAPLAMAGGERVNELAPLFVFDRAARRIAVELQTAAVAGFEVAGPSGRRAVLTIYPAAWTTSGVAALAAIRTELRAVGLNVH